MAALASSRQHPPAVAQLTPPSSSHGGGASWDFAVPLDNTHTAYEQESYMSQYAPSHATRQPHTSQANGLAKPVRSPTWGSQNQYYDNDPMHRSTDDVNELHSKSSGDMDAIGTDPNSVLDHYKNQTNNKSRAAGSVKAKPKKKPSKGGPGDPNWVEVEKDQNNWIHRDKLKEIETKELEAAGFRVGRGSRSNSRSQSQTRKPRDRRGSSAAGHNANGEERSEGRRVVSPIPAEDEDPVEQDGAWSPTTFEELAAGGYSTSSRTNNHSGRPSTSRIPLPKTSGIPVPASLAEREAPLPRSRAGSDNWNGDAIATNGARVRSGSIASQFLLDEPEDDLRTTPPYGHARKLSANSGSPPKSPQKSPMKAKTPNKAPASGARKTSAKTQPKSRQTSGATPAKRPGTSGGGVSRPTTSHRPEGEAPWLATMYKPDPRLPPDQQIIPTHAKRMQQEQWETEGRVGSMYDKDFRLLNTDEMDGKRLSQIDPIELERERENKKARENGTWPLPSPEKDSPQEQPSLEKLDNASKTQGNEQGAYKLTPTIPQGPRAPSPKLAPPIAPPQSLPKPTRLPEPVEDEKPKKSLCCIVM